MSKIALTPNISGTGTFTIASPGTSTDRTLTLPDNSGTLVTNTSGSVSQAMLASGVAGTGPAFSAYMGTNQTVSNITSTKLQFNTERFDTNNNYDPTTNYRFTPTVAGYYHIIVTCSLAETNSAYRIVSSIWKNGSQYNTGTTGAASGNTFPASSATTLLYMNGSTDYVEGYVYLDSAATSTITASFTWRSEFSGALVRAA
jgi:hypothetical protein